MVALVRLRDLGARSTRWRCTLGLLPPPYAGFSNETCLRWPTVRLTTLAESVRPLGAADCVQAHRARERSDRSPMALPPPLRQPGSGGSGSPPCHPRQPPWRSALRAPNGPLAGG